MNTDNILSYILLSGCNDNDILEDVLKYQKNPSFEEIVRIGTNLEVSRSIVHALPGSQYPQNKTLKVTGKRSQKGNQKSYKVKWGEKQTTQSRVFKSTNLALEDLKKRRLCTKCAKYKCTNKNNCIPSTFQCRKCFKYGHFATSCVSGANNYGKKLVAHLTMVSCIIKTVTKAHQEMNTTGAEVQALLEGMADPFPDIHQKEETPLDK